VVCVAEKCEKGCQITSALCERAIGVSGGAGYIAEPVRVQTQSRAAIRLKTLAVCFAAYTLLARHIGVNLPVKMWGSSILKLVVERPSREDQGTERGWVRGGCSFPAGGLCFLPRKLLISLILKGCILMESGCYNLKLYTWFTTPQTNGEF
jgi:hypothetical protein